MIMYLVIFLVAVVIACSYIEHVICHFVTFEEMVYFSM